jgi:hypothetical protein
LPSIIGGLLNITNFTGFIFSGGNTFTGLALRRFEFEVARISAGGFVSPGAVEALLVAASLLSGNGVGDDNADCAIARDDSRQTKAMAETSRFIVQ